MKPIISLIAAALMTLFIPLGTATAGTSSPASCPVVAEAMRNNGELQAQRMELEILAAGAGRAAIHPDPVIDLGVETGELTGGQGENRYSVGVSREILTFGKVGLRRAVADKELAAARARIRDAERLLTLQARERLLALQLAREITSLVRRTAELDRDLVRIAEERFTAGDVAEVDVQMARVEAARARERTLAAEREEVTHLAALAQLLGLPPDRTPAVPGTLSVYEFAAMPEGLVERALRERPDLRAQALELAAGEEGVTLARAEGRPNITAVISYSYERSTVKAGPFEEESADSLIGLHLSVPFPAVGRRESLVREANARKGAAQQRLLALKNAISWEVQGSLTRLRSAQASLELYRHEMLPRVEQNLAIIQEAYRLGEAGILNVIEEHRKFQDVNSGYLLALHDWNLALATLEAAVGSDLRNTQGEQP